MPTALAMRSLRSAVLILEANLIWRRRRREGEGEGEEGGGKGGVASRHRHTALYWVYRTRRGL